MVTIELARSLRGAQVGRSTLKVRVPDHETLVGYSVATPHGTFQLDDSMTVEPVAKDKSSGNPLANPFDQARLQLTSTSGSNP